MLINFDNYEAIREYIIRFLNYHHKSRYLKPLGTTQTIVNQGTDAESLESASIEALSNSNKIKYKRHTPLRIRGGDRFPVYVFLIMDMDPTMYAKYTIWVNTGEVFWLGWHRSNNPNDSRFKPLNYKEA